MKADILPVVTSSDINAYSMARAFHEAYGVKSLMIARKISGTIDYSKILDFRCEPNLTDDKVFMDTLRGIYEEFKDQYKHIIILGCTDHYVRLIVAHKKELSKMFVVPYADQKVLDNLILKENFYKLCDKNKVDYPATKIFKNGDAKNVINFARNLMDYGNGTESNVSVKFTPYLNTPNGTGRGTKLPPITLNKTFQ